MHKDAAEASARDMRQMTVNQREQIAENLESEWAKQMGGPVFDPAPSRAPAGMDKILIPPPHLSRLIQNSQGKMVKNEDMDSWLQGFYLMRVQWMQALIDPRRNLDFECGYPPIIIPKQYRYMYDREGVATRTVSLYPDECWATDPIVGETEDPKDVTAFEKAWKAAQYETECNPLHYLHRIDTLSGIGRYGLLLLGMDDGMDLSIPLPGLDERGQPTKQAAKNRFKVLFMRPFDEMMAHIINYERDPTNPRFGRPVYYHVIFADIRVGEPGMTAAAISVTSRVVHWTRVLHIADNRESSEVFGVPRMQSVFNRLCDVRKILGGSAEMFWKGGFPGYSFELNPELTTAGVTLDEGSIRQEFERYSNGLQRYLSIVGLQAKSLAPQIADPGPSLTVQLQAIAMAKGCPLRIFMGSEQAQLASGQDVRTWNRRLMTRQKRYLDPCVLRPFINRMQNLGVYPPTPNGYFVRWPDINVPSEEEKSTIADRVSAALMKYVMGGAYQVFPPYEYLTVVMGFPPDIVKVVMAAAKKWSKSPDFKVEPPNTGKGSQAKGQGGSATATTK